MTSYLNKEENERLAKKFIFDMFFLTMKRGFDPGSVQFLNKVEELFLAWPTEGDEDGRLTHLQPPCIYVDAGHPFLHAGAVLVALNLGDFKRLQTAGRVEDCVEWEGKKRERVAQRTWIWARLKGMGLGTVVEEAVRGGFRVDHWFPYAQEARMCALFPEATPTAPDIADLLVKARFPSIGWRASSRCSSSDGTITARPLQGLAPGESPVAPPPAESSNDATRSRAKEASRRGQAAAAAEATANAVAEEAAVEAGAEVESIPADHGFGVTTDTTPSSKAATEEAGGQSGNLGSGAFTSAEATRARRKAKSQRRKDRRRADKAKEEELGRLAEEETARAQEEERARAREELERKTRQQLERDRLLWVEQKRLREASESRLLPVQPEEHREQPQKAVVAKEKKPRGEAAGESPAGEIPSDFSTEAADKQTSDENLVSTAATGSTADQTASATPGDAGTDTAEYQHRLEEFVTAQLIENGGWDPESRYNRGHRGRGRSASFPLTSAGELYKWRKRRYAPLFP